MKDKLRILNVIDTLSLGGAERVAVNISNALAEQGIDSHLCTTRKGGDLEIFVRKDVKKLFLGKSSTLDIGAILRLRRYIKRNQIDIVHAHSSSFFISFLCVVGTEVKLVWHNHNGNSKNIGSKDLKILQRISRRFDYIYSVNTSLKEWAINVLKVPASKVEYLPNYAELDGSEQLLSKLNGSDENIKIVCLANLRDPKDHLFLLNAIKILNRDVSLYLVGNDYNDSYSASIKSFIADNKLQDKVYILGLRTDIGAILNSCDIGVLSSKYEGLPVSLLEYGMAGLPVICTNVGECGDVLKNGIYGIVVENGDVGGMAIAMAMLIDNKDLRVKYGEEFRLHVEQNYSKKAVIEKVINKYKRLIDNV